jgi:hypothetical protein
MAVCALALLTSGCLPVVPIKYYAYEGHSHTDFHDLTPRDPATPVHIVADLRFNGNPHPEGNPELSEEVARVLRASHVLTPVESAPATLTVVLDDAFDAGDASSSGWATGLTLGLIGLHVKDSYTFTVTFKDADGQPRIGHYVHAMETVHKDQPQSKWRPFDSPEEAFAVVVKQAMLDFLADLQAVGNVNEPITFVPQTETETEHQ